MNAWSTACPDWERRILAGEPLVPDLPLFRAEAERGLRYFKQLRIPDVFGTPTLADACGEWFFPIVSALFGSYNPQLNVRMIQEYFLLIPKKNAKALDLDTEVATPSGFTAIRDIKIGDLVIGEDGKPTEVIGKSDVFRGHDCFEVEFSTGEKIVCDAGHLWLTDAHRDRDRKRPAPSKRCRGQKFLSPTVKTTAEIAASVKVPAGRYVINNHRTGLCASLDLPTADLPIPPYALGVWLGDGTTTSATVTSGKEDADELVGLLALHGQAARASVYASKPNCVAVALGALVRNGSLLKSDFRQKAEDLVILGNKHIPTSYLRASREQRLALLQGLMDTDGTISKAGQASFCTTLPALRIGFIELVNSLGLKASCRETRATCNGKDCGPAWNVQFWPFDSVPVFGLRRKLNRQNSTGARNSARSASRQIVSVTPIESRPVQCISVANASKQFLISRSLIPTHNSSNGGAVMVVALLMNKRPSAEFLLIAPTKEIADIAFKQASGTILLDQVLAKKFHIQRHIRLITYRPTGATLQIKAADTDVITGSKATGTMIDETHVFAKKSNAADVFVELRGALTARPDGFLFQTTTQSKAPPIGVFKSELEMARRVRDGLIDLPLLPVLYELPVNMTKDGGWKDRTLWGFVNPNMGRSVNEDFLARELLKAEENGAAQLALLASQHFNVEIGQGLRSDGWAGAKEWPRGAERGLTLSEIIVRSEVLTVGIDGGGLDDLLGVGVIGREKGTGRWLAWAHAFISPEGWERRKANRSIYEDFIKDGDLTLVEQLPDDVTAVVDIVRQCLDSGKLAQVGCDPAGLGSIVDSLAKIGVTLENEMIGGVRQGVALMGAIKTIERKLVDGSFRHGGRAMTAWCAGNAIVQATGTGIRIARDESGYGKVDPLMAILDAGELMGMNPTPKNGPSCYETRPILMV